MKNVLRVCLGGVWRRSVARGLVCFCAPCEQSSRLDVSVLRLHLRRCPLVSPFVFHATVALPYRLSSASDESRDIIATTTFVTAGEETNYLDTWGIL